MSILAKLFNDKKQFRFLGELTRFCGLISKNTLDCIGQREGT